MSRARRIHPFEQFRAGFREFDWTLWDEEHERDVTRGKWGALAEKALRNYPTRLL